MLEDIEVEIIHKNIKNIYLRVLQPDGKVNISAPFITKKEVIFKFAYSKLDWIKKQKIRINRNTPAEYQYVNNETHHFMGRQYQLRI